MRFLVNLVSQRFSALDFSNPLVLLDLFFSLFLIFGFLFYLKRFPVFRVFLGTLLLLACSILAFFVGFIFTALVFGAASGLILVSLPLIFAPEIRHYLEKLGRFPFLRPLVLPWRRKETAFIRNLVDAVFELAERKIGATIVFQRKTGLIQTIETGVVVDAAFSSKLLQSIFAKTSPLHDGAAVIGEQRIIAVGCLLPLAPEVNLDPPFGTRHRSAVSITRDTDAVSLIISEQRGEVSLAENRKLFPNLDRIELTQRLERLL